MEKKRMKIEDVIRKEGVYVGTVSGVSMYPMLRSRKDTVVICPCTKRPGKYDVVLYKYRGKYILHRVLETRGDSYVIRGDNCIHKEYGIRDRDIIGILTAFHRGDREIPAQSRACMNYARIWCALFPLRLISGTALRIQRGLRKGR